MRQFFPGRHHDPAKNNRIGTDGSAGERNLRRSERPAMNDRNPEQRQVAVALQYDKGTATLPRIVASGRGAMAEQILALAFANGVKVREDADLATILAAIDVDSEIPIEAIAAVAEILTHVYRANGQLGEMSLQGQEAP
jgi:flagellar biosynthesis protein